MTPFASIALFRREGRMTFKNARKEASDEGTQARKSAARYWNGYITDPDKLMKVIVGRVRPGSAIIDIAERSMLRPREAWVEYALDLTDAMKQPHLANLIAELGIDPATARPPLPDVLEINGAIYRREI